jgi:NAD(P)-dependent dehydrogenase (short-subunit alcohol dehydrogenase family)
VSKIIEGYGKIDVLLSNSGITRFGLVEDIEREDWTTQFLINVFNPIRVVQSVVPYMRRRRNGSLVFVTGLGGLASRPGTGVHAACKNALEGEPIFSLRTYAL